MNLEEFLKQQGAGSASALARKLGVTETLISCWRNGVQGISPRRAIELEEISNGEMRCEELVPDFPWERLKANLLKRSCAR